MASAHAADVVVTDASSHGVAWTRLPAPQRMSADAAIPAVHRAIDLRTLVGRRDKRASTIAAIAWARELGNRIEPFATGPELVAWATEAHRLAGPTDAPRPGDLLVFDRTDGDDPADLVAVVVARDDRGVTEFVYPSGGAIRRGFADPKRPALRRDETGAVVNTFMRTGKRWPPKGTHYLAGELLSHVVRF